MNALLVWIRHMLILLPAVSTLYVERIDNESEYILYILLGLLLVRIAELRPAWSGMLLPGEIAAFGWLASLFGGQLYFLLYASLIGVFLRIRRREPRVALAGLTAVMLYSALEGRSPETLWTAAIVWLTLTALLAADARTARHGAEIEELYDALARSHEQLEQARLRMMDDAARVEDHAQAEERSRIAREIHDDLGHRLIRLKMMMEAVLPLLDSDPPRARGLLEHVRAQLEEGMETMRRTVRKLKPPEEAGARRYALDRLIEEAGRDMRIDVRFSVKGRPSPLYPSVEYVLYRNAQEAITNAVRHGGASSVDVELDYGPEAVTLSVANNGAMPGGALNHGIGLRGMQERIAMLGGRLLLEQEDRFRIITVLPQTDNAPASKANL